MDIKLSTTEAAVYLEVTEKTLAQWRSGGIGPHYYKPTNKTVYYFKSDLDTWIKGAHENQSTQTKA